MRPISIFCTTALDISEYNGIPVKAAYYTCGNLDGRAERILGPANHAQTYVIDGKPWDLTSSVLVRTGNSLSRLPPVALEITRFEDEGDFKTYYVTVLPGSKEREILDHFNLTTEYMQRSSFSDEHANEMRRLFERFNSRRDVRSGHHDF